MHNTIDEQRLFGPKGPQMNDIKQGAAGDCYFDSTLAAYAAADPDVVRSVFMDGDHMRLSATGMLQARFFVQPKGGGAYHEVLVPLDGEIPIGAGSKAEFLKTTGGKMWMPLLEVAYAKFKKGGFAGIGDGGYANQVMEHLTGKKAEEISLKNPTDHLAEQVYERIQKTLDAGGVVITGSETDDGVKVRADAAVEKGMLKKEITLKEANIIEGHDYTVVAVFEKNGKKFVRLRNPWGSTPPGGKGTHGIGDIPLEEFVTIYSSIDFGQSGRKASKRGKGEELNDVAPVTSHTEVEEHTSLHESSTGGFTSAGMYKPTAVAGSLKTVANIGDVRLNGSSSPTGPQEILIEVPESQRKMRLANIELTHSQVLSEKSVPWDGSKTHTDTSAPYTFIEVNVAGKGWTSLGQRKKFPEARQESERLHDLPPAGGDILAVRIRNVGIDPLHVQAIGLDFLPEKPQHFDETIFTPGMRFGDAWNGQAPASERVRDVNVKGTRYPEAIILNNNGWAETTPAALSKAQASGWTVEHDSILVPLTVGKRFKLAEVSLGDTHPDPNLNGDGSYGRKGWSKLTIAVEHADGSRTVLTNAENVPPQGVMLGSSDIIVKAGDKLRIRVSNDTAGVMGVRVGYDDVSGLAEPTAKDEFGTTFKPIDRPAAHRAGAGTPTKPARTISARPTRATLTV